MHNCPDCGQGCNCSGDIEDHDTGDEFADDCIHCLDPDTSAGDYDEDDAVYPDDELLDDEDGEDDVSCRS